MNKLSIEKRAMILTMLVEDNSMRSVSPIKIYGEESKGQKRYSPASYVSSERRVMGGNPDMDYVSTSFVERNNLTMHMGMRRFTRLTNGFSKKIENLAHAVALPFMHYNFARIHKTLKVSPAMAADVTDKL
jgi:hypothetical protein